MNISGNGGNTAGNGRVGGGAANNNTGRCGDSDRIRKNNTNSGPLLRKIQELCFAKNEAALYLDAHPECALALEYLKGINKELERLTEEFENNNGPLTWDGVMGDRWSWVDGIWPWQLDNREER